MNPHSKKAGTAVPGGRREPRDARPSPYSNPSASISAILVAGVVASLSLLGQARGAFLESGGLVVIEAEHFQSSTSASGHLWVPTNNVAGFVGDAAMAAMPNSGTTISANAPTTSPALNYQVQFAHAGNYKFWVRGWAATGSDDSIYVGVDGVAVSMTYATKGSWSWKSVPVTITNPGPHQVSVWMREDGAYVDRLLLTTNKTFTPTGNGPAESPPAGASPSDAPPTVQITAPADGSYFTAGTPVAVSVNAADADGTVASVDYYLNGVLATRQTTAPFGFTWATASGLYQLWAVATDNQGATNLSSIVNVAVTPIPGTFFEANNLVVMEAEHFFVNSPASAHAWIPTNNVAGYTGGSAMAAMPNSGTNFSSTTGSPMLGYLVQLTNTGAATLWIRGWAAKTADNTVYLGVDGGKAASVTYSQTNAWVWQSAAVTIASPGLHEVYLWMHKDGAYADRLILSLDSTFTPTGSGPAESVQASAISPPVASFVAGVTAGVAPLTVVFTNQSTGATGYAWDFGDGNVSTLASPGNTYISAGTYSVTLTAVGPGGTNVLTMPNYITVSPSMTVQVTSPASGFSALAGTLVPVTAAIANAGSPNVGVEYFVNGALTGAGTTPPFTFNWTPPAGNYQLVALATNDLGNYATSAPVSVTITSPPPMTVQITSPASGFNTVQYTTIPVSAGVANAGASVVSVLFFVNGAYAAAATNAPFMFNWTPIPPSTYQLSAIATNNLGISATSAPVSVTITSLPPLAVQITSPVSGANVPADLTVPVSAQVLNGGNSLVGVQFFVNGTLAFTDTNSPPTFNYVPAAGPSTLVAVATNDLGSFATSAPVSLIATSAPVAQYRYASSGSSGPTIYITNGGFATLSQMATNLPKSASGVLVEMDPVNHVWFLGANIILQNGSTLLLHGSAQGGDVDQLLMKSENNTNTNNIVRIDADYGTININGVKITSTNDVAGPDTEFLTYQRAFIRAQSLAPSQQSTLNVFNSDIGFLGYNNPQGYGLTWEAASGATVFGDVSQSLIHDCQLGVSTWSAFNVSWLENEIANNFIYGFTYTNATEQAVLAANNVHDDQIGALLRYASSSQTLYVYGGGVASLLYITNVLSSASQALTETDPVNHVWFLFANISITDGATLLLHGTAQGGDVDELLMKSDNSNAPNSYVSIIADWGTIDINGVNVTSWDEAASGPDTEFLNYQRAYISAVSRAGPPIQQSTLNVLNSDIGFLGYENSAAYGLTWNAVSSPPGVTVFGTVSNSFIHDCQLGVNTWSAGIDNVTWVGNQIATNVLYGFNASDPGQQTVLAANNVHDNILGAALRYASSTSTIYVEGGGVASPSDIHSALPSAPLVLTDAVNQVWVLRANIVVDQGSTLLLHGTAQGGDVNQLLLQSDNSSAPGSYVTIIADWGTIDINGVQVTSWDDAANGPDTEYSTYQRAYISAVSRLGPPIQQSTLNVLNSDIGYLGYNNNAAYGLTWNAVSSPPGVSVFGTVSNSFIHDCQLGVNTWSAGVDNVTWVGNQIATNVLYGFNSTDPGQQAALATNNVHDNTYGLSLRYASSTRTIYLDAGGTATLTDIHNALPAAPLVLTDAVNQVWVLRANIVVDQGSTLLLHGTAQGGDVNQLRLQSDNSGAAGSYVAITADWGTIDINGVKVTSWDDTANGPDTEYSTYQRAYISAVSRLGPPIQQSTLNVLNSDIGFLGYNNNAAYGLTWDAVSSPPGVTVFGTVSNSFIHNCLLGVNTWSAGIDNVTWIGNEIATNVIYGFIPTDPGQQAVLATNNVHDNVYSASLRYATSTGIIYVEGGGVASLSDIHSALPSAPLVLTDAVNHIWFLAASIEVDQGSTLLLHGTAEGGDVNYLHLKSDNPSDTNSYVWIDADWGTIDINGVKVTSWDEGTNGPDAYPTYQRAYIRARSRQNPDFTIQQSTLNVLNSDIGYLGYRDLVGYDDNQAYGLCWDIVGTPTNVTVFGTVSNSVIHDCQLDVLSWSGNPYNVYWISNTITFDTLYDYNVYDPAQQAVLASTIFHDNTYSATFRWSKTSNTIHVTGPGIARLTDIMIALTNQAPLTNIDPVNAVWYLGANLFVENGAQLQLYGPAIGGDVAELRLKSDSTPDPNNFNLAELRADWGYLDIRNTKITSWDNNVSGPTTITNYGRAFIHARSRLSTDGVTALESRMDVLNSEICYLGTHDAEAYGLTWKLMDDTYTNIPPGVTNSIYDLVQVHGDLLNSHIHHNFFGMYSYGLVGAHIATNEVDHNIAYGLDPHNGSDNLVIENNNSHDNGWHGIIASKFCMNGIMRNNVSWHNGLDTSNPHGNGLMLHRYCNGWVVENNLVYDNPDSGIAIFGCSSNIIRNNICLTNTSAGIRLSVGAAYNWIEANECGYLPQYGFYVFEGDDDPDEETGDTNLVLTGRCYLNTFTNNYVHDYTNDAIKLADGDTNTFTGNLFIGSNTAFTFEEGTNNMVINNAVPSDTFVELTGSDTNSCSTTFEQQPVLSLQVDTYSTANFADSSGAIFDFGANGVATKATTTGSSASVTWKDVGLGENPVFTRNFLVATTTGSVQVTPTTWTMGGNYSKAWTAKASSTSVTVNYIVGDLQPGASYLVAQGATPLATLVADSGGEITFTASPGTKSLLAYTVTPQP